MALIPASFDEPDAPTTSAPVRPQRKPHHTCNRLKHPSSIPRPPNAFILFRSDFLQKSYIPRAVESKQKNLSRIAAECWNDLTPGEKRYWYNLAAKTREEHYKIHPYYVYTPQKNVSKDKRKRKSSTEDELALCTTLRSLYVPNNVQRPEDSEAKACVKEESTL